MKLPKVTSANYRSKEVNQTFYNYSQIKTAIYCMAGWKAERDGEWISRANHEALNHGTYIDLALLEDGVTHQRWCMDHKDVVYNKGSVKAGKNYKIIAIDEAIERARNDEEFMDKFDGNNQAILFFEDFHGFPFRCKLDDLALSKARISDLKSCRDIDGVQYSKKLGRRAHWIEDYGYVLQAALYQDAVYQKYQVLCKYYIGAMEKTYPFRRRVFHLTEDTPGYDTIHWQDVFSHYIQLAVETMGLMHQARDTNAKDLPRCEQCEYCWSTRKETETVPFRYDSRILNRG